MWVSVLVGLALLVLSGCQALCQAEMILFCQFVLIVKPKNGSERGPGNIGKHQANIFPQVPGLWSWRDGPGERKPKACYEVDGGEMKAVRDWSALAFWNVTALLLCFGIPALPWTALLLYCHQQPVPQWEMTLLDQRSPGPAENWDMMEKKESILTYSLLALGSQMDFFSTAWEIDSLCLLALLFVFFLFLATFLPHGSFTCFRYYESSLAQELSSLKFPRVPLQLIMELFSFPPLLVCHPFCFLFCNITLMASAWKSPKDTLHSFTPANWTGFDRYSNNILAHCQVVRVTAIIFASFLKRKYIPGRVSLEFFWFYLINWIYHGFSNEQFCYPVLMLLHPKRQ